MRIPFSAFALAAAVAGLVWAAGVPSARAQGATYKIVAFSNQPAPGGDTFYHFDLPTIGADGTVGFATVYDRQDERIGVFSGVPGNLRRIISLDDPVPGEPDGTFSSFGPVSVSKDGLVAFNAQISFGEGYTRGMFVEGPGGGSQSIQVSPDITIDDFGDVAFRSGDLFAKGQVTWKSQDISSLGALLGAVSGVLTDVLHDGDMVDGRHLQTIFDPNNPYSQIGASVDVNESGKVAIMVGVQPGPSPTPTPREAIFAGDPSSPKLVAEQYGPAPGLPTATLYHLSPKPSIAANGFVAFAAQVQSSGPYSAAFSGVPGAVVPVVLSGDIVPTTSDVVFGTITDAVVNSTGDVIFGGFIQYPNSGTRYGFWVKRRTGEPVLLACDGMMLATPSGDREVSDVSFAGPGTFNDLHQFVFRATFTDGTQGIYVADTRPGAPLVFVRTPRKPRDFVTTEDSVQVSGLATDDTGVEKVEYTVAREVSANKKGGKNAKKKKPKKFVVTRVKRARGDSNWSFKVPLSLGLNLISIVAIDKLGNASEPYRIRMLRYDPGEE